MSSSVSVAPGLRPLGLLAWCMLYVCCLHISVLPSVIAGRGEKKVGSSRKKPGEPSPQILATLAFPSGTLAWQTINFKLVPHSSHSASSALSRHMLPTDDGPIPGSAALS